MDHAVGEELLVVPALEHVSGDDPIRAFRDEETGDPKVAEPLEQPVDFPPAVFELREDLERLEGVDDDQVEAPLLLDRANPLSESLEPIFLLAEEVRGRPRIEDDERPFRDLEAEAEGSHLFEEARSAFLEAQVQAVQAGAGRVLEEDRESEGGLHRAGAPSIRTTWPRGTPPSSVSSRPSTKVRTRAGRSLGDSEATGAPLRAAVKDVSTENASSISSRMSRSRSSSAVGPIDSATAVDPSGAAFGGAAALI